MDYRRIAKNYMLSKVYNRSENYIFEFPHKMLLSEYQPTYRIVLSAILYIRKSISEYVYCMQDNFVTISNLIRYYEYKREYNKMCLSDYSTFSGKNYKMMSDLVRRIYEN